jgi:hypothetical protein
MHVICVTLLVPSAASRRKWTHFEDGFAQGGDGVL